MVRRGDIDGISQEEVTLAMRRPRRAARGARVQALRIAFRRKNPVDMREVKKKGHSAEFASLTGSQSISSWKAKRSREGLSNNQRR
jgi:predicted transcriptional regulator